MVIYNEELTDSLIETETEDSSATASSGEKGDIFRANKFGELLGDTPPLIASLNYTI